jgi:hypothetical protein
MQRTGPHPRTAIAFVLVCAMAIGGLLSGCDGGTHLKGVVVDSNDLPIADADVTLTTGELKREIKSSDRGVFKIGMVHSPWNPELTLAITKPGFKPFEKRFHAKEHLESVVVTLEPASEAVKLQTPFSVSIVPGRSGITIAKNKPDEFFVVLTNISGEPQAVWERWNSWGYQTISFELTTTDGRKFGISRKQENFTRNAPPTFLVKPGENQVFAVRLDEWWKIHPTLPKSDEMPITLKAIYEIRPTAEATEHKVWTGRLESHTYSFSLRQW